MINIWHHLEWTESFGCVQSDSFLNNWYNRESTPTNTPLERDV